MKGSSFQTFRSHCIRKHYNWQHNFTPTLEDPAGMSTSSEPSGCTITSTITAPSDRRVSGSTDGQTSEEDREDGQEEMVDCTTVEDMNSDTAYDFSSIFAETHSSEQSTLDSLVCKADVKTAAAKFILILKEKFKLTQVSLDYTVKTVEELLLLSNKCIEQSDSGLASDLHIPSPFGDLKTEYQQTKFFKENFGLVVSGHVFWTCVLASLFLGQEPISYELGTSFRYQQTGAKRRLVEFQETCQYIPLVQNLEKLLNNQDVYQEVYCVL